MRLSRLIVFGALVFFVAWWWKGKNEVPILPPIPTSQPSLIPSPKSSLPVLIKTTQISAAEISTSKDPEISEAQAQEMIPHIWSGGGFEPPGTPGFEEHFLNQRRRSDFVYGDLQIAEGLYRIVVSEAKNGGKYALMMAQLELDEDHGKKGMKARWLKSQGKSQVDLSRFQSIYAGQEVFNAYLRIPKDSFPVLSGTASLSDCKEVLILRHFNFNPDASRDSTVQFFNGFAYCRRGLEDLRFLARVGFTLFRMRL